MATSVREETILSLNESIAGAVGKKTSLFDQDHPRFLTRGVLAGAYLALGTAFAGVAGQAVEQLAPGLGAIVFAALFGLGLFAIVVLGAELATGSMMFFSYAAVTKQVSWGKATWIVFLTTVYNLIGVVLIGAALGVSAKFADMDPSHLLSTISIGKVEKPIGGMFVEGMVANFVVNMAIISGILSKEVVSKFVAIVPIIAIFVGLSTEHVVANFCVMVITLFASDPIPAAMTMGSISLNWTVVWIGNFIGGGLLMGGVYAWLNKGTKVYRD